MKIVQIGFFPLNISCIKGGVEASIYGILNEQKKTNQLIVIDIPRTEISIDYIEEIDGVNIYRFAAGGKSNFSALSQLKKIINIIRIQKPDICHIHTTSLFAFFTYLFLRYYHIPTVVTIHGLAHIEKKNMWITKRSIHNFIKYIFQSQTEFLFISICPIFIVDTQYVADIINLYKRQWKIIRMPICLVIPQGINSQFFHLNNISKKYRLLAVGSINKRKGHLILIESMLKIKRLYPDFSLSIVGTLSDQKYYELLLNSINEKELESQVKIYPNATFDEILNFYKNAEIFVLSTEEESQGIVFCEAMAAGLPIVATKVGGVPWVVKDNINGILCDFGDSEALADNVIKLFENESFRNNMREMNKIESHKYDWGNIAIEIMNVYQSII